MKKINYMTVLLVLMMVTANAAAQRFTDILDRGLVAVNTSKGVFVSWRIQGEEYYDTHYNLYRDGDLVADNLTVSNYVDAGGTADSRYSVAAVTRNGEGTRCADVDVWTQQYKSIKMGKVPSRTGKDVSEHYVLNDACAGDLDGDGELEIIVKRVNRVDAAGNETEGWWPVSNDSMYSVIQAYKLNGTLMWTIDAGPNQISHGDCVEMNCQCYDWDMDGKAEVLMRITESTVIYHPDGTTTEIGSLKQGLEDRYWAGHSGDWDYTATGREWLLYADGATCKPYGEPIEYPLKRVEDHEKRYNADGSLDVYGSLNPAWHHDKNSAHRANKFFFGAPYLDGVRPSIFLARGIYTRIKMCALDVDPVTHKLTQRWRWEDNKGFSSPWFGQGYHNYSIADVDLDGRDEIVYGSMVIDDNGKGLNTTGLGHGDAHHTADLNPYVKGLEVFACNEDNPNNNYRDATTGVIYHRSAPGSDDGRCMAGNFSNSYLGAQAFSNHDDMISCVTNKHEANMVKDGVSSCFRIYWDGDLCEETLQTGGGVYKYGSTQPIFNYNGAWAEITGCNGSKDTPCLSGDILGDWREEIVVASRNHSELRIYTTTTTSKYGIYTLWHDHQYRNAMFWQPNGYNQPPHVSYFIGQAEGYTIAPPPLTTSGRLVADNVTTEGNGKHVLVFNNEDATDKRVEIQSGAQPDVLTVNAFIHTEGHDDNDNITTSLSSISVNGTLSGNTRLVRQGEGVVNFKGDQSHCGETSLWGGVTTVDGSITNSHVVMHRFAELCINGSIGKGVEMEYGAVLHPMEGSMLTTDTLLMNFGSVLKLDLYSGKPEEGSQVKVTKLLKLVSTTRTDAPQCNAPVVRIVPHYNAGETHLAGGSYVIAEADSIAGNVTKLIVEGLEGTNYTLSRNGNRIVLNVTDMRPSGVAYWNGDVSSDWDLDKTANWNVAGERATFVSGDKVVFDDAAVNRTVEVKVGVHPAEIVVCADNDYTIGGTITGATSITKQKAGKLTLTGENTYSGGTVIEGGAVCVASLVAVGKETGNLGTGSITLQNGGALQPTKEIRHTNTITLGEGGGTLSPATIFHQDALIEGNGQVLSKAGKGALHLLETKGLKGIVLDGGTLGIKAEEVSLGDTVWVKSNSTFADYDTGNTYSLCLYKFHIAKGAQLTWNGCDSRCEYRTQLFGEGTLALNTPTFRTSWSGDWSKFEGTVKIGAGADGWAICNGYGLPKATLDLGGNEDISNNGQRFEIGVVKGEGKLRGVWSAGLKNAGSYNTWVLGTLDKDFTLKAVVCDNSVLEKVGTGKMTVTSACEHTGGTLVKEGELCINRNSTKIAALGTGAITVYSGSVLSGKGLLGGNVTVQKGGKICGGISANSTNATLAFGGKNLTMGTGTTLHLRIKNATSYTKLSDIGTFTFKGTLLVSLTDDAELAEGDELTLWTAGTNKVADTITLELPAPGEGLCWDTSRLAEGVLVVVAADPSGISQISSDGVKGTSFDLSGRRVNTSYRGIKVSKGKKVL